MGKRPTWARYDELASWPATLAVGDCQFLGGEAVEGMPTLRVMCRDIEPGGMAYTETTANLRVIDHLPVLIRVERRVRYPGRGFVTDSIRETRLEIESVDVSEVPSSAFRLDVPDVVRLRIDRTLTPAEVALSGRSAFWLGPRFEGAEATPFYDCTSYEGTPNMWDDDPIWRYPWQFTDRQIVIGYWKDGDDRPWETKPYVFRGRRMGTRASPRLPDIRVATFSRADVERKLGETLTAFTPKGHAWEWMLAGGSDRVEHHDGGGAYVARIVGDRVVVAWASDPETVARAMEALTPVAP